MSLTTYESFVLSRAKPGNDIIDDLHEKGLYAAMNRLHALVGLITEMDEIQWAKDDENLVEELGDYYFYLTLLKMNIGDDYQSDEVTYTWEEARSAVAKLLDLSKKEIFYNKELNKDQISAFLDNVAVMEGYLFGALQSIDMAEVELAAHNMAKLEKRYPTGYTNAAAAARADKKEGE
jgi:hypothetical protein